MFIYISDLHLSDKQPISRVDSVFDAGMYKLEYVLKRAKELGTFVICGGDFFHEPRVSYKMLNGVLYSVWKPRLDRGKPTGRECSHIYPYQKWPCEEVRCIGNSRVCD